MFTVINSVWNKNELFGKLVSLDFFHARFTTFFITELSKDPMEINVRRRRAFIRVNVRIVRQQKANQFRKQRKWITKSHRFVRRQISCQQRMQKPNLNINYLPLEDEYFTGVITIHGINVAYVPKKMISSLQNITPSKRKSLPSVSSKFCAQMLLSLFSSNTAKWLSGWSPFACLKAAEWTSASVFHHYYYYIKDYIGLGWGHFILLTINIRFILSWFGTNRMQGYRLFAVSGWSLCATDCRFLLTEFLRLLSYPGAVFVEH